MRFLLVIICFVYQPTVAVENGPVKMLILKEETDQAAEWFRDSLPLAESDNKDLSLSETTVSVARRNQAEAVQQICQALSRGVHLVVDMTWTGWSKSRELSEEAGVPYVGVDILLTSFIKAADDVLHRLRNATDSVLIFENKEKMEQSLYYLIKYSLLRILVLDGLNKTSAASLQSMRPSPSFYVIIANTHSINKIYAVAQELNISERADRWHLVFTDFRYANFNRSLLSVSVATITLKEAFCCYLLRIDYPCECPEDVEVVESFVKLTAFFLSNVFLNLDQNKQLKLVKYDCNNGDNTGNVSDTRKYFYEEVIRLAQIQNGIDYSESSNRLRMESEHAVSDPIRNVNIGTWYRDKGLVIDSRYVINPVKRFFRVGTAESIPWSYRSIDPTTGLVRLDKNGNEIWEGYCLDFLNKLAEDMNFDYELVINEQFGTRSNDGTWNGLVGDLATGQTDIVIAALTMTSEREEVIDFVAPYFEQTGISIVIRKPVRKTSLFKFMTVLRLEVWISIVVALIVTGVMIWLLDKYSPYSARNNKQLYPYPCRVFTLKESFWFALTSFTPQGGGEAPKALSGRTLVAAYWLFVVLMLATFTANLAAFLTVERMQSPVQSLEQLSRQSRINYTVVENSDTHNYFRNMKNAEDVLYTAWKQITLNSSSYETQYRVWDYPIREQYGHILQAIEKTGPVPNASVGYQKVMESEQGEFALIHDASEIKYEVSRNCNLTEVGELFAEQPYSVAVQQGSQLNEEISRRILDLQKDRYFETLLEKYWNTPTKSSCHIADDNEGITLESLGGVFIATLFGLGLAMVTLSVEIFYHKNKKKSPTKPNVMNKPEKLLFTQSKIHTELLTKKEFGVENVMLKSRLVRPKISFIHVMPQELY